VNVEPFVDAFSRTAVVVRPARNLLNIRCALSVAAVRLSLYVEALIEPGPLPNIEQLLFDVPWDGNGGR